MKEFEIRPKDLFDEFLAVSKSDIPKFFSEERSFVEVPCPGCLSERSQFAFKKHGFSYRSCPDCYSLFVSPRPTAEMINNFYRESASSKFWAERFFPETAEARRVKIFRPRAELVGELTRRFSIPSPWTMADIGSGIGLFLEEVQQQKIMNDVVGIEPSPDLARVCRSRGFQVVQKTLESIEPGEVEVSLACCFEVLEHLFDPTDFLRNTAKILKPGGLMMFTTLTVSGFDLQILWDKSKSLSPPHHINFISVEGYDIMLRRAGFEPLEIETPGKLDIDIISNMLQEDSSLEVPRFLRYLLDKRPAKTRDDFQLFLQNNSLSSHIRLIARKA